MSGERDKASENPASRWIWKAIVLLLSALMVALAVLFVVTWFIVYHNRPCIPCGFCTNRLLKRWTRQLETDDRVVLRIGGKRISGRARRVKDAPAEFFSDPSNEQQPNSWLYHIDPR